MDAARALALSNAHAALNAALSAVDAPDKTPEQILEEMAESTRNAAEHGTVPGTRAAIDRMKRKWCRFVAVFGVRFGYVSGASPSLEFVRRFVSFMHNNRDRWSAVERKGLGMSAFLSAAYHLPKYVFPELEYAGWSGLDSVALKLKGAPYKCAVLDEHKRIVVGSGELGSTGKVFEKRRWCSVLSNLVQDRVMTDTIFLTHSVTTLAVLAFVEATCARSGAFSKDRFDRMGLNRYWMDHVVLKVIDFKIGREGMAVTYGEVTEYDAVRAEVTFNRIKRHYYERYEYGQSMTPDDAMVVRRSGSWMLVYLFRRGVFEVQWAGMSADARASAASARASGAYAGGMPPGAVATAEEALRQIISEGKRSYALEVESEPLFVEFVAGKFLPDEMHCETVARLYSEISIELGLDPDHSGAFSARRKHAVTVRRGCEARGMGNDLAKKSMAHRLTHDTMTKVYDDDLASEDMGALSGGSARTRVTIESLKSLLVTRVPKLSLFKSFGDIGKDDPIRVSVYENDLKLCELKFALVALKNFTNAGGDADDSRRNEVILKRKLNHRQAELRYRVLKLVRRKVWSDGQRELETLPMPELRARVALRDWAGITLEQLMLGYALPLDLTDSNLGKRVGLLSAEGAAKWTKWELQKAAADHAVVPRERGVRPGTMVVAGGLGATASSATGGACARVSVAGVADATGAGATGAGATGAGATGAFAAGAGSI
jgi:hypothetical protein